MEWGWLVAIVITCLVAFWIIGIWQKAKHVKASQEAAMIFAGKKWEVVQSRIDSPTFRDYQVLTLRLTDGQFDYILKFSSIRPDFNQFEALVRGQIVEFVFDSGSHRAWGGEFRSASYFLRLKA